MPTRHRFTVLVVTLLALSAMTCTPPRIAVADEPAKIEAPKADAPKPADAPVTFIALGKEAKTVEITVIAAYTDINGGMNFNGQIRGGATFTIPVGWTVNTTFINKSAVPHSASVVDADEVREIKPKGPAFKGANSPNPEVGTGNSNPQKFSFVADAKGKYAIVCAFPTHAMIGHWIRFNVVDESAKPAYDVGTEHTEPK